MKLKCESELCEFRLRGRSVSEFFVDEMNLLIVNDLIVTFHESQIDTRKYDAMKDKDDDYRCFSVRNQVDVDHLSQRTVVDGIQLVDHERLAVRTENFVEQRHIHFVGLDR